MEKMPEYNLPNEEGINRTSPQVIELADKLLGAIDLFNDPLASILIGKGNEEYVRQKIVGNIEFLFRQNSSEKVSAFIAQLAENNEFMATVRRTPDMISNLCTLYRHQEILTDPVKLSNFSYNQNLYHQELLHKSKGVVERIQQNPFASEDELDAGVYREDLESQVRDAVFIFRKKGYNTFESGFGDNVTGEQFIGFDKSNMSAIPVIPDELAEELSSQNISITMRESKDRYSLRLTPTGNFPSLEEWKEIWKIVTDLIPSIHSNVHSENVHTGISREFREKQEKIKKGESVYLGHGLRFEDRKSVV